MSLNVEQTVLEGLRRLPSDQQQEVLEFVQQLARKSAQQKTIWEKIDERAQQVPVDVWETLPPDGAEQHDHYLYGAPKK
jgi:hypothetical protein